MLEKNPPGTNGETQNPKAAGGSNSRKGVTMMMTEEEQQLAKCPRCDSFNTKFCYYNNYSLSQPRHFCKTCRRYWTKGGALRNVPVGGGCRKNKKLKSSSSSSHSTSLGDDDHHLHQVHHHHLLCSSDQFGVGGLKFFNGISPAIDFQLGSLGTASSSFPRAATVGGGLYNPFSPLLISDISTGSQLDLVGTSSASASASASAPAAGSTFLGFNYPPAMKQGESFDGSTIQEMGGLIHRTCNNVGGGSSSSLASSIESLSTINQELHWKLQQQRLAILYGTQKQISCAAGGGAGAGASMVEKQQKQKQQQQQPIMFQGLEISAGSSSRKDGPTEWFFDSSFAPVPVATPTPTNSGSNGNNHEINIGLPLNSSD
ncbi:hypothetical protein Dimus_017526 [Dionaea muscipula]